MIPVTKDENERRLVERGMRLIQYLLVPPPPMPGSVQVPGDVSEFINAKY